MNQVSQDWITSHLIQLSVILGSMLKVSPTFDPAGQWLGVGNGLSVYTRGSLGFSDEYTVTRIELAIEYDTKVDRFIVSRVTVSGTDEMPEVTGAVLRDVRVQEILQDGAIQFVTSHWDPDHPRSAWLVIEDLKPEPVRVRANSILLEQVALVYRASRIVSQPPLKEVARVFAVSHSTATRLVARAREEGRIKG